MNIIKRFIKEVKNEVKQWTCKHVNRKQSLDRATGLVVYTHTICPECLAFSAAGYVFSKEEDAKNFISRLN